MKNGLLIWNVILSLVAGFLLFKQFNSKKTGITNIKTVSGDSMVSNKQFRMAYFEMDSIAAQFDLVKGLKKELTKKEDDINAEMTTRNQAIQQKLNYYQKLLAEGKLSKEEEETASNEVKSMDNEMKNRKQQMDQDYNNFMVTKQNEIKSKIEAFIKEYNKTKNYSYVVSDDPGLFYFQDTAFNITADVIKGLNEMYKSKKN
jgi:outer membrane protein